MRHFRANIVAAEKQKIRGLEL